MEVEHFDPRKKKHLFQDYQSYNLSSRHCNSCKGKHWSNHPEARFLNPSFEEDYGVHIFEDPDSHKLVGVTPAGIYHVLKCGLNAPHLVKERQERWQISQTLNQPAMVNGNWDEIQAPLTALKEQLDGMIPLIPFLPKRQVG